MNSKIIILVCSLLFCVSKGFSADQEDIVDSIEFSGEVADQDGNELKEVTLEITKQKIDTSSGKEIIEKDTEHCGVYFFYGYSEWDSISFSFVKKGYEPVTVKLSAVDKMIGGIKKDLKIVLRKIGSVPVKKEENVKPNEDMIKIQNVMDSLLEKPLKLSGVVMAQSGKPLDDVKVQIIKALSNFITMSGREDEDTEIVNGSFSFIFKGWHSVTFLFTKKGYYPERESLSLMNENIGNIKKDIKVVLREIGDLPQDLIEGEMFFLWEKEDNAKIIRKGWSYIKDEDGDIKDEIIFNDPKEVEFYIEKNGDGKSLYLISNNKSSGFISVPEAKNFTYLNTSPEKGYSTKVEIKEKNDGACQYFYFKLHDKLYGKLEVNSPIIVETRYQISVDYFINPSGSTNVTTLK